MNTPCPRNLPQHFNGCLCVASTKTAGEVLGLDLIGREPTSGYCGECGAEWVADPDGSPGVKVHVDHDGERDYDADADHTPFDENEYEGMFFAATEPEDDPVPAETARATAIASAMDMSRDDFAFTPVEAFEMNRAAAITAADSDNEFEMRMSGTALLSTIEHVATEANDVATISRLRSALEATGPDTRITPADVDELRDALRAAVKVGDNNLRTYQNKTARQWREEASSRRRQSYDSFERSDTDGALTQWAADVTANKYDAYAELASRGGKSEFPALMDTNGNLVPAKLVNTRFGQSWMLLNEKGDSSGKWVNPSHAATAEKRNAAMAKKGYQVGLVRTKAGVGLTDGLTPHPYFYRADSGFDPNAEIVATTETEED